MEDLEGEGTRREEREGWGGGRGEGGGDGKKHPDHRPVVLDFILTLLFSDLVLFLPHPCCCRVSDFQKHYHQDR